LSKSTRHERCCSHFSELTRHDRYCFLHYVARMKAALGEAEPTILA
jgi:hypothetical protein